MRLLFFSPLSLFDTTNGGTQSMRLLLEQLARMRHRCEALSLHRFTGPPPAGLRWTGSPRSALVRRSSGVVHTELSPKADVERALERCIERLRPDVLMALGTEELPAEVFERARRSGIPVVLQVLTPTFQPPAALLRRCERVLVPSRFMQQRLGEVRSEVLPPIIDPRRCRARRRSGRSVTFINPMPEKGLTVVARLAELAQARLPGMELLVVEGRWTRRAVEESGLPLADFPNVTFLPNQADVRRVYARTRILVCPSLWPEPFGMVVAEAHVNGIPVLCSSEGGLAEAGNGAAIVLDAPRRCVRNPLVVPTAREVAPWLRWLERLEGDPALRRAIGAKGRRAARAFAPAAVGRQAAGLLGALLRGALR